MTSRDADGFTLIELLMSIAILGIVLGTVGLSVTQGFRHTTSARGRIDRSNLSEFVAKSFGPDVASADGVPTLHAVPWTSGCGAGSVVDIPVEGGNVIQYAVVTVGDDTVLERRQCDVNGLVSKNTIGRTTTSFTAVAGCVPDAATCRTLTLTVSWSGDEPNAFTLRATRRAA